MMRFFLLSLVFGFTHMQAQQSLILPTKNDAIYKGGGPDFYMYVDRTHQGIKSKPWEAGQYGYVRNPQDLPQGRVYTRFHEGIDIKPLRRDADGVPLDEVVAVDAGKVVYVNDTAGASNYGRYVVIEHNWDGCPYYSLYAHLRVTSVKAGHAVRQGDVIGILGWTGAGLNKERAHLHFEINLLMNSRYQDLYNEGGPSSPNHHGIYNGLNLTGIDVAKYYLARQTNTSLTVAQFLSAEPVLYRVLLPATGNIEILERYPWMVSERSTDPHPSWEIHFSNHGVPVKALPNKTSTASPRLSGIRNSNVPYQYLTRGHVRGNQGSATLSPAGLRALRIITYPH